MKTPTTPRRGEKKNPMKIKNKHPPTQKEKLPTLDACIYNFSHAINFTLKTGVLFQAVDQYSCINDH